MKTTSRAPQAPLGWRSLLFLPQFAFARAARLPADGFILDLQDTLPLYAKDSARTSLVEALRTNAFAERPVIIRINEADCSALHESDLEACVGLPGVTALMPTRITWPDELDVLHQRVSALEDARGLPRGHTRFLPLLETPSAVLNARRVALAGGGRNLGVMLGHGGLFRFTDEPAPSGLTLRHHRNTVIAAARAAGIEAFDAPFPHLRDRLGLEVHASEGHLHGFNGKCCLHPDQVEIVNRCMGSQAYPLARRNRHGSVQPEPRH